MDIPIGELSRQTGVKVPTIRYYEQVGLMPVPPRTAGWQRRYGEAEVARLNFIRHSRELGFEVDAIRELLTMSVQPDRSCAEVDIIARRHLVEVERRIKRLVALKAELSRMIGECHHGRVAECRVIAVLSDHGQCIEGRHETASDPGPIVKSIRKASGSTARLDGVAPAADAGTDVAGSNGSGTRQTSNSGDRSSQTMVED